MKRVWFDDGNGGTTMVDVGDVVAFSAKPIPGALRHLPGGRTEQGPTCYDVVFRLRSGHQERCVLNLESYHGALRAMEREVMP